MNDKVRAQKRSSHNVSIGNQAQRGSINTSLNLVTALEDRLSKQSLMEKLL